MEGDRSRITQVAWWQRIGYIRFQQTHWSRQLECNYLIKSYSLSAAYIRYKHNGQHSTSSRWTLNGKHSPSAVQIDIHMRKIEKQLYIALIVVKMWLRTTIVFPSNSRQRDPERQVKSATHRSFLKFAPALPASAANYSVTCNSELKDEEIEPGSWRYIMHYTYFVLSHPHQHTKSYSHPSILSSF